MKIEIRANDTIHISGYVNAVERESTPVITRDGKVNEIIESGVFQRALDKVDVLPMSVDHDPNRVIADTKNGLRVYEDAIGLRAEAEISDPEIVQKAREGKIKGWSFGMKNIVGTLEERADKLPLRRIKEMMLDHITLVVNKKPVYSATSVELRAEEEDCMELRSIMDTIEVAEDKKPVDYSALENRLKTVKGE